MLGLYRRRGDCDQEGCRKAADAAAAIGEGLQAFCIPGSVADQRKLVLVTVISVRCCWRRRQSASAFWQVMSPSQPQKVRSVSQRRQTRFVKNHFVLVSNGLGKDAAQIISRINGFTFVETKYGLLQGKQS